MGKIKQSPKQPAEKRRQQLIKAARKLFVKKGYRGTSTEEIARAAKLTKGALYYHFKTKEDILFTIVEELYGCFEEAFERAGTANDKSPLEILHILRDVYHKQKKVDSREMTDIWVQAMRIPRIARYLETQYRAGIDAFAKAVDPAYGRTLADRRQLAVFTFAVFDGLAVHGSFAAGIIKPNRQIALYSTFQESVRMNQVTAGGQA